MKYFLDTEFIEGTQSKLFGKTKPTIDLISIGIVCEDGREYYAISKDFNLKEAWNRWQWKLINPDDENRKEVKEYWIRENVLRPIFEELWSKWFDFADRHGKNYTTKLDFNYYTFKFLLKQFGKTNKQIVEEVYNFCTENYSSRSYKDRISIPDKYQPQFYGYYSDYDWVVFCWLFGKMIDLPKGFPMYCIDLKQTLDKIASTMNGRIDNANGRIVSYNNKKEQLEYIKGLPSYPKQTNEHNALQDARWNFELHEFLKLF